MKRYTCKCGSMHFKKDGEKIVCNNCGKDVSESEEYGFFSTSDSKVKKFFCKLGLDIGAEAAAVGASTLVTIIAPWSLPFTLTAMGVIVKNGSDALSDKITGSLFSEGSYGKKTADILRDELKNMLRKGKKDDSEYCSFARYHSYCSLHYSDVISYLLENDKNTDIYSDEAITAIISDKFGYPGRDDPAILENIRISAKELRSNFEDKILEDKSIGIRWLIEKNQRNHDKKLDRIIELLMSDKNDDIPDDETSEYIDNYSRPLFLEEGRNITLGKIYLEAMDKKSNQNAMEAINDWYRSNEKMLFVFGAAGIGKTSLVTKIISDVYGISGEENILGLTKEEIHPIILRDHVCEIAEKAKKDAYSALKIIQDIIDIPIANLKGHLIVLDGLDELYVLSKDFKCSEFIKKLQKDLNANNIKVLITLRPIKEIDDMKGLNRINLYWTKTQISEWCDNFSDLTTDTTEKKWCKSFKATYSEMIEKAPNDKRLEMFSLPIILYLACKSNTIISDNNSIGEFYDKVFRSIIERKHISMQKSNSVFDGVDHERLIKLINWQYTKELAYQMYLTDKLTLTNCDSKGKDRIEFAKNRTISELNRHGEDIPTDYKIDDDLYLAVSHFANKKGEEKGIEFVHKTVYEYFAAVKLYEDYFSMINKERFTDTESEKNLKEIWGNIIEAFRYKGIGNETAVFDYLNEMTRSAYNGTESEEAGFDFELFKNFYIQGMEQDILSKIGISEAAEEYNVENLTVNNQLVCAYRNLTWFLTGHGYKNQEQKNKCMINKDLIGDLGMDHRVNCSGWFLKYADLRNTCLIGSVFKSAELNHARLNCAILSDCSFDKADLTEAHLENVTLIATSLYLAKMKGVKLNNADLRGAFLKRAKLPDAILNDTWFDLANFREANLQNATIDNAVFNKVNFSNANLRGTKLEKNILKDAEYCLDPCYATIFPQGFEPQKHGMIEVDINGQPVKGSNTDDSE
ncbi:pentapeptide repeat-containing protein [Ruminococcus flavefaciens]|uniref:Uncharacterized protein YjbI, contains pentapeptide repeats n=1 Tax=Ruminococcus flavefaciens TaxID=1265 RepID=A0A1K1MYD5_RUMFL|nr:pentapeptide repeat-containing protein [Ruminococcus flavefaciens]SFW28184.1 Uncharacterized protein YjbI, contains pentapeptide repeats [Ruminococcus flavefaciens]